MAGFYVAKWGITRFMKAPRTHALRAVAAYLAYLAVATVVVLLLIEGVLRVGFAMPRGLFHFRPQDGATLYLPNAEMHLVWDLFPYTIRTNALGFRGPEIAPDKPDGTTRILALGDSVTVGFYVNDAQTWPRMLETQLRGADTRAEVINAGLGDTSLDTQRAIYLRYGLPLDADRLVLTFVANDIDALRGKSRAEMLAMDRRFDATTAWSEWLIFGRSAIGEWILDRATQWRVTKYRNHRQQLLRGEVSGSPVLAGATDFAANVGIFLDEHARPRDGIAGYEDYTEDQHTLIANYLYLLDDLHRHCTAQGTDLLFVYFPDYPEIYDPDRRVPLNGLLREACAQRGIPFLDLLPAFRAHPDEVLHFAPLDFHPNARGNAVIARAIAEWLLTHR